MFRKQQIFLLTAALLGTASCSTVRAISQTKDPRLTNEVAGSHVGENLRSFLVNEATADRTKADKLATSDILVQVNHGGDVIADGSEVLEMEQKVDRKRGYQEQTPIEDQSGTEEAAGSTPEATSSPTSPTPEQDIHTPVQEIYEPVHQAPKMEKYNDVVRTNTAGSGNSIDSDAQKPPVEEQKPAKKKKERSKKKKSRSKKDYTDVNGDSIVQETMPPPVAPKISDGKEELLLNKLVKELEVGTLMNSITLLRQLCSDYPDDPDYKQLLARAIRLRDGDVWYDYQRKTEYKIEKPKEEEKPPTIIKPTSNESVNELKKSSWFLIRSVKR